MDTSSLPQIVPLASPKLSLMLVFLFHDTPGLKPHAYVSVNSAAGTARRPAVALAHKAEVLDQRNDGTSTIRRGIELLHMSSLPIVGVLVYPMRSSLS